MTNPRPRTLQGPDGDRTIRAVLFDVDGTLYRQGPMRLRMAVELGALPLTGRSLGRARSTWRQLRSYRNALERVRALARDQDLAALHYRMAAESSGSDVATIEATVEHWMRRRPLRHLARCRRSGLLEFLEARRADGHPLGVFSDYPVGDKLDALGVRAFMSLELCATDPDIMSFKPRPDGLLHACERWQLEPGEVLYVGDRAEVDAVAAAAAGMPSVIIRSRRPIELPTGSLWVRTFGELAARIT